MEAFFKTLTDDVEVSQPGLSLAGVDLTHVGSLISPLDVLDVQVPGPVAFVTHADPGVPGDHVVLHRQNSRTVKMDPSNLV